MAFLDKKITELAFISTPGQDDRIAIVNLGVTKQTSVSKFLQSVVAVTGSFIEDATIADNIITFTRADSTTFTATIASSSYAVNADNAVTASYSLEALSASFAAFATSASYALTASHALNVPETASYSITSSYSLEALSSSFAAFATSASYAVTASHALNVPLTASYALTASFLDAPVVSASYALTASHALNVPDTASNADTASRVNNDLTNGLGVDTFIFNGSVAAQVQVDTSSAHFLDPINAATASLSSSASTSRNAIVSSISGAFDAVSASLTTTDQAISSSVAALSSSASTAREVISSSVATDIVTNSASIAALSQSAAAERLNFVETSSIIGGGNIIQFTKGGGSQYLNTIITSSFVKSVNGVNPDPTTGNVNTSLTAVSTGTSASMLAASSSATLDNGEVWIISGQTGGDPISGSGSNGEAYIFDSGSGQLFKLANTDQAENDIRYVIKSGDTMTGQLILSADPTLPLGAAPKQYVDRAYISSSIVGTTLSLFTGTTPATEHSHSITDAISASYAVSASHSEFADSSSYALTSSKAISASYAISASHVEFADSASYSVTSSHAVTASYAISSSHTEFADSASYSVTSSHAISSSYALTASYAISASHEIRKEITSSNADTASFVTGSGVYGPYGSNSIISSSWSETSSFSFEAISASISDTASFITASNIYGPHGTSSVVSASYALTASHLTGIERTYRADFTGVTSFVASHNLNTEDIVVQVYQEDATTGNLPVQIVPDSITLTSLNDLRVDFAVATTGYVVVSRGGFVRSGSVTTALTASTANQVKEYLNQGLGIETFAYNGNTAGILVQLDTASAHFLSSSVATASFAETASYVISNTYRENVAGDVRYIITHNLNEQYPMVQTYDTTTNRQLIPDFVESTGLNTLNIEYAVTFSGIVIVQK